MMQDLLTLTLESLAIAVTLVMFLDFFYGLRHLYNASATTIKGKPEEAILPRGSAEKVVIAFVPTPIDPDETAPLNDPWTTEVEEVIESFSCHAKAPKTVYLLPPAVFAEAQEPEIDYSGWTIRALKKEAQNRKLSKYSSLTKNQLISRLTAA